jgi:hypothetical protein
MNALFAKQPFTLAFAVILGLVLAPLASLAWHATLTLYDSSFPVVDMHGEVLRADQYEAVVRIRGRKIRNCTYLRVQALTQDESGALQDAYIQRVDMGENGDTKMPGNYYLGDWRIWPRGEAVVVIVNVNHLCGDRLVTTRIVEVKL